MVVKIFVTLGDRENSLGEHGSLTMDVVATVTWVGDAGVNGFDEPEATVVWRGLCGIEPAFDKSSAGRLRPEHQHLRYSTDSLCSSCPRPPTHIHTVPGGMIFSRVMPKFFLAIASLPVRYLSASI